MHMVHPTERMWTGGVECKVRLVLGRNHNGDLTGPRQRTRGYPSNSQHEPRAHR